MRKKFVCEFLNVSRPFQANWAWRGASSHGLSLSMMYCFSTSIVEYFLSIHPGMRILWSNIPNACFNTKGIEKLKW
jgi:hypothetical protein